MTFPAKSNASSSDRRSDSALATDSIEMNPTTRLEQRHPLADLLARVEGATGPDRYADCWLACAFDNFFPHLKEWPDRDWGVTWRVDFCCYRDGGISSPGHGGDQMVWKYTTSLDAALALCSRVLPGWEIRLIVHLPHARIHNADYTVDVGAMQPTLALSVVAAMLKAVIAKDSEQ